MKLEQLQAQLRKMDGARKQADHLNLTLTNQGKIIDALQKENRALTQTLDALKPKIRAEKTAPVQDIKNRKEAIEHYDSAIQRQAKCIARLDHQIKELEGKIADQKKANALQASERQIDTEKSVRRMQVELQRIETEIAGTIARKNKNREVVQELCLKKGPANLLHRARFQERRELREAIKKVKRETKTAQKERKELISRGVALKRKAEKELSELDRAIGRFEEIDRTIRKYEKETQVQKAPQKILVGPGVLKAKTGNPETKARRSTKAEEKKRKDNAETLKCYEATYKTLMAITGQVQVNDIIDYFKKMEKKNNDGFDFAIHRVDEMVKLKQDIQGLQGDILQLKIQETSREAQMYEDQFNQSCATVDKWIAVVDGVFGNTDSELSPFVGKLKAKDLTYQDTLEYFQTIEREVSKLLRVRHYLAIKDENNNEIGLRPMVGVSDPGARMSPPK
ncbi:coiled-coil domain-containing protein 63-like [Aquarana catesbeiana]|uniref:coiled-coil domain-containing protein 63-like n=1 Tax=Aquarana catesbeiana TaxID=8400 RepID=UPI003CC96AD5